MDNENDKNLEVSAEELKADEEIQKGVTDEELGNKVVADYGLDPEADKELIEKIVADKKSAHDKLFAVVGQKIKLREQVKTAKPPVTKEEGSLKSEDVDKIIDQRMAERELNALDLPDDIKSEIKDLAKLKNISVGEASKLPYIQSKISEVKKEQRVINGTPIRINVGSKVLTLDPTKPLNPADFDLATDEGQKAWKEAKAEKEKYRQNNQ